MTGAASPAVAAFLQRPRPLLIGGEWVETGAGIDVTDPATGERIGSVAAGGPQEIDRAVAAARRAFEDRSWRWSAPGERAAMLLRLADLLEANADELAELEVRNQGKPIGLAQMLDVGVSAEMLRYYATLPAHLEGISRQMPLEAGPDGALGPSHLGYTIRQPVGVVGAIIPWNVPILMAMAKVGPALAAGCTVILKPSEETPLTALRVGELLEEAGVPPGVVNIVPGLGAEAGAALAAHPGVDKVTFTGSTATGRRIIEASAGNLKRVALELGGKTPVIVFADADLDAAAEAAAQAIFLNCGQMCFAGSRLIAEESIADELVERVVASAKALRLGHGLDPATDLGPLVSERQLERVLGYIEAGIADGADVLTGGGRHGDRGWFVEPTVMRADDAGIRLYREEVFGPVLVTQSFDDPREAVRLANDTDYGLAASVFTNDLARAHAVAAEIDAGTVWLNTYLEADSGMPNGGFKQSGWGREDGMDGFHEYTEIKSVVVRTG